MQNKVNVHTVRPISPEIKLDGLLRGRAEVMPVRVEKMLIKITNLSVAAAIAGVMVAASDTSYSFSEPLIITSSVVGLTSMGAAMLLKTLRK